MYHCASDRVGRWHLFLEDLGCLQRIRREADFVLAAQALGEMNGGKLDESDVDRHPWLRQSRWTLPAFAELASSADALDDRMPSEVVQRTRRLLHGMVATESRLLRRERKAPIGLRHGDAHAGNVAIRDGQTIFFDLATCTIGPVGHDLASLLGVPFRTLGADSTLVERCLADYLEGLRLAGSDADPAVVEHAYRLHFVRRSLAWLIKFVPGRLPARRSWRSVQDGFLLDKRQWLAGNLVRVCDEGERLLNSTRQP